MNSHARSKSNSATATLHAIEPRAILLVVSDPRQASLFRGTIESPARIRLTTSESLANPWMIHAADFQEHQRPTMLERGYSNTARQHGAAVGHESLELESEFALEIARWIHTQRAASPSSAVAVFAPPRFLGQLRNALTPLVGAIELFRGEFAGLTREEVASHPTIRLLVSGLTKHTRGVD